METTKHDNALTELQRWFSLDEETVAMLKTRECRLALIAWADDITCHEGIAWPTFKRLAKTCGVPIETVKSIIRQLKTAGLVYYSVAVDCDGIPHGSGYFPASRFQEYIYEQ